LNVIEKKYIEVLNKYNPNARIIVSVETKNAPDDSFVRGKDDIYRGYSLFEKIGLNEKMLTDMDAKPVAIVKELKVFSIDISLQSFLKHIDTIISKSKAKSLSMDLDATPKLNVSKNIIYDNKNYDYEFTGKDIKVAVLDTGVDDAHPDISIIYKDNYTSDDDKDTDGHGTHVIGIIAGRGVKDERFKGIAPSAKIISLKVLPSTSSVVAKAMFDAVDKFGADIINMSLGVNFCHPNNPMFRAATKIFNSGALVIASAGNWALDGNPPWNSVSTPACNPDVIAVGSISKNGNIAYYSCRGPGYNGVVKPDIVAPGGEFSNIPNPYDGIISTRSSFFTERRDLWVNEYYVSFQGTSMAAPHVSGAAAVIKEAMREYGYEIHKNTIAKQIRDVLLGSAKDLMLDPNIQGAGLLNLRRAIKKVKKYDIPKYEHRESMVKKMISINNMIKVNLNIITFLLKVSKRYKLLSLGCHGNNLIKAAKNGGAAEVAKIFGYFVDLSYLNYEMGIIYSIEKELPANVRILKISRRNINIARDKELLEFLQ